MYQYLNEIDPVTKNWKMGDYPMWIYFAHESKIKFENNVTGVRRVLESSASHFKELSGQIDFLDCGYDVSVFFLNKFSPDNIILSDSIIIYHMWMLFTFWCKSNSPKLKNQIDYELKKVQKNKSLRMRLIQLTFTVPILRYLFFYYYKIRNEE